MHCLNSGKFFSAMMLVKPGDFRFLVAGSFRNPKSIFASCIVSFDLYKNLDKYALGEQ